jgi:hypothetical protein
MGQRDQTGRHHLDDGWKNQLTFNIWTTAFKQTSQQLQVKKTAAELHQEKIENSIKIIICKLQCESTFRAVSGS